MFRASSAHLQQDTVVHVQHMVLSLSMRVLRGLSVHSLSEKLSLKLCTFKSVNTIITNAHCCWDLITYVFHYISLIHLFY